MLATRGRCYHEEVKTFAYPARRSSGWWLFCLAILATSSTSCGLIDLDSFKQLTFDLPKKKYQVDTSDGQFTKPPAAAVPAVPCGAGLVDCCNPGAVVAQQFSAVNCSMYPLTCEGVCAFNLDYEVAQPVNLVDEVPALGGAERNVLEDVFLKSIKYGVDNELNVDMPPVDVYVAPAGATTVKNNPVAKLVVNIPARPRGETGTKTIEVPAAGQQAFSTFAKNFKQPFTIISVVHVKMKGGDPFPQGKATIELSGKVETRF
jgi:hypothetical protein